jgi:MYXO-CTERM domain-containing protein
MGASADDSGSAPEDLGEGGVNVIASQTVGPYDTVVLQATNSGVLVEWLQEQGYSIPSDLEPVLQPYLAEHQYFVALKLSSDKDAGDLSPLGMTYCGHAASIPIQLTSVAAIPDLPIEVFVLGPTRAVPDNYLHVRINEAAVDWYAGGTNYRDVVKRAADEAAGQAFATDFSGSTISYARRIWSDDMLDVASLRLAKTSVEWLDGIVYTSLPPSSQLTALLTAWAPAPVGVDQADFLQCPDCYASKVSGSFDAAAATDALQTEILDPLAAAQRMVDAAPHLTRMFTTMDPSEMTMDPLFVFNPDVEQEIDSARAATNEYHCGVFGDRSDAQRVLVLSDGRRIALPSEAWMADHDTTELEYMDELTSPAAIVIENLSDSGPGEIIQDYREQAADEAAAFGQHGEGCACATVNPRSLAAMLVLLAGVVIRRRSSP